MSKRKSKEDPDWVPEAGMVAGRVTGSKDKVIQFDIVIPKDPDSASLQKKGWILAHI